MAYNLMNEGQPSPGTPATPDLSSIVNATSTGLGSVFSGDPLNDMLNRAGKGLQNFGGNFGMGTGVAGTSFDAPSLSNPNIANPLQAGQLDAANQAGMNSISGQQALLNALQKQGGLNAQNSVLGQQQQFGQQLNGLHSANNLADAYSGQNQLTHALAQAGGLSAQQQAIMQQQMLNQSLAGGVGAQNQALAGLQGVAGQQAGTAAQLQGIANGTGPNPAMAALNNATGQNVANQAALMAGQRGAGANIGLLARQAAQQGAATQQNAVGQGAQMQAQQSMNALNALQGQQQAQAAIQGQIGQLGTTQAGMQQAGIGQLGSFGQNLMGAQQNAIAQQAQQAMGQANLQQGAIAQQGAMANQMAGQQIQGQQAATNAAQNEQQQALGAQGAFNTVQGGLQQNVNASNAQMATKQLENQGKMAGNVMSGLGQGAQFIADMLAEGGEVGGQMKSGPRSAFGQFLMNYSAGGSVHDLKQGGSVNASSGSEKAKVAGNSYSNDTIPAMLSEGEIVIPRSVMQGKDPIKGSAAFVAKVLREKGRKHG